MKRTNFLTTIVAAAAFAFGCAQGEHADHRANADKPEVSNYTSRGVVKNVDKDAGKVTIDHEDIPGYMEAMEMSAGVADAAMLDQVAVGDAVDFDLRREGSRLTVTKFTKTGVDARVASAAIYQTSCAECHGGRGEGADKGIPLTSGHALHHTEADFIKTVTDGKGKGKSKEMPAFRDKLTAEQIAAIVKFVREDIQKGAEKKADHGHSH